MNLPLPLWIWWILELLALGMWLQELGDSTKSHPDIISELLSLLVKLVLLIWLSLSLIKVGG